MKVSKYKKKKNFLKTIKKKIVKVLWPNPAVLGLPLGLLITARSYSGLQKQPQHNTNFIWGSDRRPLGAVS